MKYYLINSTSFWISCIGYILENRNPKVTTTASELIKRNSRWRSHYSYWKSHPRLTAVTVPPLQIKNELMRKLLTTEDDI